MPSVPLPRFALPVTPLPPQFLYFNGQFTRADLTLPSLSLRETCYKWETALSADAFPNFPPLFFHLIPRAANVSSVATLKPIEKDFLRERKILKHYFFFFLRIVLLESIIRKIFNCQRDKFIFLLQIYYIYI